MTCWKWRWMILCQDYVFYLMCILMQAYQVFCRSLYLSLAFWYHIYLPFRINICHCNTTSLFSFSNNCNWNYSFWLGVVLVKCLSSLCLQYLTSLFMNNDNLIDWLSFSVRSIVRTYFNIEKLWEKLFMCRRGSLTIQKI